MKKSIFLVFFVLMLSVFCFCTVAATPLVVDGSANAPAGTYPTLEAAVAALPATGGEIVIHGEVTVGDKNTAVDLPTKSGKVTVTGESGAKLIIARGLRLGCELEIDDIELVNTSTTLGFISAQGHTLTVGEGVTTSKSGSRWLTLYGSTDSSTATNYDTHLVVRAGTYRYIYGGGKAAFSGSSTVEVSSVVVEKTLSAKNEKGTFSGTGTLILDLRGNKTVQAGTYGQTPSFLTDTGYSAMLDGTVYSQAKQTDSNVVYVDGTGATEGAFRTLEAAIESLPATGGDIVICGDTAMPVTSTVTLPSKSGKVTVTSQNGASLIIGYRLKLGSDMELDNIKIVNASTSEGSIFATGHELIIGSGVTTDRTNGSSRWPTVYGGDTDTDASYDTHVVIRAGTFRNIFGGNRNKTLTGNTLVELSNVTFSGNLSAKNENGTLNGTAELVLDLRSGKTVTGGTYKMAPTDFLTDTGYSAVLNGSTYSQVKQANADTLYVDGTGATAGAYPSLEAAVAVLPSNGGTVIVVGDTTAGSSSAESVLPVKDGKLVIKSENGAKLKIARGLVLGCETEFDGIEIVNVSATEGYIAADGNKLTIGENVTTSVEGTERRLTVLGGNKTDTATDYDSHLVIRAGTYRYIFGGNSKSAFNGDSTVEVSNITVTALSALCEKSAFNGSYTLTVDLRGNKTVTVTDLLQTPEFLVDDGYRVVVNGTVYSQVFAGASTVYVDGTGATEGAYPTLEEAVAVLPHTGGTAVVVGDTTVSAAATQTVLALKNGKVTVQGEGNATLTISNSLVPGSDLEFTNVNLAFTEAAEAIRVYGGLTVTVADTVNVQGDPLVIELGDNGKAIVDSDSVSVVPAEAYEVVVSGNVYTTKRLAIGFISNASGNDRNDGLSDRTPKALQGQPDGNGIRNLLDGGGLMIVCGNFNISDNSTWDYGGKVTIVGSYNNKDYKNFEANTGIFKLKEGKTVTVVSDLTFDDILFYVEGSGATIRVPSGSTFVIGEKVDMINSNLRIEVEAGGTAIIQSGRYGYIKGDGNITVTHCEHADVRKNVEYTDPTCVQRGIRYDKCRNCGLYIGTEDMEAPIDPTAHDIRWTFGATEASATCANGCGFSVTQVYREVEEIHVSSAGTLSGDFTAARPVNDFGLAMAFAAAQSEDVTVYIHDYAVIPNNGVHSSWNAYGEPAHTNTITVRGYKDQAVLRFNNDSDSTVLVYALGGPTTFEQLEFSSWGSTEDTALYIVARHNKLVLGESLSTDLYHKGSNELNVIGGCFYTNLSPEGGCKDLDTDVTILSGNYTNIYAGAYFNGKCCVDTYTQSGSTHSGGDVHLTVGGNITARRQIRVGNHGDSSTYANMNDAYINVVGDVAAMRYFIFSPSKEAYRVQNVYLRLYDGFIRVGEELGNMNELGYEWGSAAYGEPITARIAGKLYVYGNSESVSAMGMYTGICGNLVWDSGNDGKWEGIIMDESYCSVSGGAHTPLGDATEHLDATCMADGYNVYTCSACGKTYAERIAKLPHTYGDVTVLAATCIAPEMEREVCTACGNAKHTVVGTAYADHTDPEKTGFCQVCNIDLTAICDHIFGAPVPFTSGCGTGAKQICDLCGKTEVQIAGDGHTYGAYSITVAPTAKTAGIKTRICKGCGKADTAPVYAQNTADASAMAIHTNGTLADFSVESTKLSKAEKAVLNELLQQNAYGSEVKIAYETDGDTVQNVVYMLPVPREYADYENISVVVRDDSGALHYVHFEIEKGYIVFVF